MDAAMTFTASRHRRRASGAIVLLALLSCLFTLCLTLPCAAQVQYAITDLGTGNQAYGINNSGQVVGGADTSSGSYHAFLYSGSGPMQDLGTLGGTFSMALGINDIGQVVGASTSTVNNNDWRAFLYTGGGTMQDLGTLPGGNFNFANAINNSGQIVGGNSVQFANGGIVGGLGHAFLSNNGGPMQDLGTLDGTTSSATGINGSGQIVGNADSHAFLYVGGGPMQALGSLGGPNSFATAINNAGKIVGGANTGASPTSNTHAFLYTGTGPMQDLGTLGGQFSWATGINNSGQVVGASTSTGDPNNHAFLYDASKGAMHDLNNLVASSSGLTLQFANAINDKGQIVGSGTNGAGQTHAFLLSPLSSVATGTPSTTPGSAYKPIDPNTTAPSSELKIWDSTSQLWAAVPSWTDNRINPSHPTVVLTNGWKTADGGDFFASNSDLAQLARALHTQNPGANILGWNWQDQAVSKPGQPVLSAYDDISQEGLNGAKASARRGSDQGILLAHQLQNLHISNNNLQLIGHSNGGAVVGAAASELALGGQKVQQITTLDTPNLMLADVPQADVLFRFTDHNPIPFLSTSVNAMKYINPSSASHVEVYYSDGLFGRSAFGFGAPLVDSSATNVFNGRIYPGSIVTPSTSAQDYDHLRILGWYANPSSGTAGSGQFVAGINWAITGTGATNFTAGNFTEQGYNSHVFGTTSVAQQKAASLVKQSVETFEDATSWLGQHVQIFMRDAGNAAARITSGSDGYLYKDVSIPLDVSYLTFDMKVETPDAGDFLTVSLGNEVIYYKPLNAADSDFWTVDPIFIGDFAGQTETLLFTLNHVGDGTPSILLDNITLSAIPEPSTLTLLGAGVASVLAYAWRQRRRIA